mmetsp:Transcript_25866/g.61510  ORF Transcript_25866/g.61510 Transcript_25866/m.61510 type:complete len:273 (+) Transcript_25866:336-1154(+)
MAAVSTSAPSCTLLATHARISARSSAEGSPQKMCLSSRPGRRRAASRRSGLLEAARTNTPSRPSTPSSAVSSWFTTLSVTPVESCPLWGAMASNSSKKRMQGLAAAARAKTSRTPCSDAPMYLLRSSGPLTLMKLSCVRPATAPASTVFPHPGCPYRSAPERTRRGARAKMCGKRVGSSISSTSAAFAWAMAPRSSQGVAASATMPRIASGTNPSLPATRSSSFTHRRSPSAAASSCSERASWAAARGASESGSERCGRRVWVGGCEEGGLE